jgi:hypothetical protein
LTDEAKIEPLTRHFEYVLELGEVRATRSVSTLVDGMLGRANRDNDVEAVFLPRYIWGTAIATSGTCNCWDTMSGLREQALPSLNRRKMEKRTIPVGMLVLRLTIINGGNTFHSCG